MPDRHEKTVWAKRKQGGVLQLKILMPTESTVQHRQTDTRNDWGLRGFHVHTERCQHELHEYRKKFEVEVQSGVTVYHFTSIDSASTLPGSSTPST